MTKYRLHHRPSNISYHRDISTYSYAKATKEPKNPNPNIITANKRKTTTTMSDSEASDDLRFSEGEEEEIARKRKKTQARKKHKTTKEDNTNKGDKETMDKLILQSYRSTTVAWCATTAANNIMQLPGISPIIINNYKWNLCRKFR